jgi:carboxypeptidase family protein/TonB-dependent receptor-like protein
MRGVWRRHIRFVVVLFLCFCPWRSVAQEQPHETLQVSIEDELGGILVGARVTLQATATDQLVEQISDDKGRVAFDGVAPGTYVLSAESPGFRSLKRQVAIGQERPKLVKLQLKIEVTEQVDVSERKNPLPQREKVEENADAIPIDDDLLAGVPVPAGKDRVVDVLSRFLSPTVGRVSIVMDGQEVNSLNLPAKAIDELVVNKSPYAPEYRRPGRARIEVVSQNGSKSHHHFDSSFLFNDSALQARNVFMNDKPDLRQWLGEMEFSGPLRVWRGSYLIAGSVNEDRTTGIVHALTTGGPFSALTPERQRERFWRGRLDLAPSDRAKLTFKYDYERQHELNGGVGGLVLPELGYETDTIDRTFRFTVHGILSSSLVNDVRASVERPTEATGTDANGRPEIVVEGAFRGGTSQFFRRSRQVQLEIQDTATYFRGIQTMRFGGRIHPQFISTTDATNFGGTFEFSDLDRFTAGRPFAFRVNQGTPQIAYGDHIAEGFFQDELKLRRDLSIMGGARYDYESRVNDYNNIAPRVAFAFAPGKQTLNLRGGFGVFYERLGEKGIEPVLLYDGARTRSLLITDPSYPNPFAAGGASIVPPSRYQFAPNVSAGRLMQSSIAVERQLWPRAMLTIEYANVRGTDLFRVRDVNAPLPGTTERPDPQFKEVIQIESSGSMRNNALNVTFHAIVRSRFDGSALYTYARTSNDTPGASASGNLAFTLPVNNYDLAAEWGRANFDIRHRFSFAGVFKLPLAFQIGSLVELKSGFPYEITTGFDNNGDGRATDRPLRTPRNAAEGPGYAQVDLRLTKRFRTARPLKYPASKPAKLEFTIDAFNVFNRANYRQMVGVLSSPLFGRPIEALKARKIQFGMAYGF